MFHNIYKNGEDRWEVEKVNIFAKATITFDFNTDDLEKVQEIFNLIREEINTYSNIKIDSSIEIAKVIKINTSKDILTLSEEIKILTASETEDMLKNRTDKI